MSDSSGLSRTNEEALLERARDGDEAAFASLVDRFGGEELGEFGERELGFPCRVAGGSTTTVR